VVEHSIGNGEVDSSILSGSTIRFLARNPLFAAQTSAFGLLGTTSFASAISAISARTNGEMLCQLTQNWHNGSRFVLSAIDDVESVG
jgi:hypothetical protein